MLYTKNISVAETFDVVVCGGGPAGVAAALCLKEGGIPVTELDSAEVVAEVRAEGSSV